MANPNKRYSYRPSTKMAGNFIDTLKEIAQDGRKNPHGSRTGEAQAILDSASAVTESLSLGSDAPIKLPKEFAAYYDDLSANDKAFITGSLLDSVAQYEQAHGQDIPPDLMEAALNRLASFGHDNFRNSLAQAGISMSPDQYSKILDDTTQVKYILDDSTSMSPDGGSLQANRAIVSVNSMFATTAPWVGHLPTDISSGESKLIIA